MVHVDEALGPGIQAGHTSEGGGGNASPDCETVIRVVLLALDAGDVEDRVREGESEENLDDEGLPRRVCRPDVGES
jgi:hypothetical protein